MMVNPRFSTTLPRALCRFPLTKPQYIPMGPGLPLYPILSSTLIIQSGGDDVTRWSNNGHSDAIVNLTNEKMLEVDGADGGIHTAAGPELLEACLGIPEIQPGICCPIGEARITPGFKLPVAHVIHTGAPIFDQDPNPEASLRSAYRNTLRLAKENNIEYLALPPISCSVAGYPDDEAATVALSTVKEFPNDFTEVRFFLPVEIYNVWQEKCMRMFSW